MYTVFIADDEISIREGLKCIMDWNEMGFEICGEASNGSDALAEIMTKQPNLVLLDIRMPKIYGIDVIKAAREQGFTGKCILLSGYSDFEYAQSAIRYGVNFYLTKPIEEDELSQSILKIKEILDQEKLQDKYVNQYKRRAKNVILQELLTNDPSIGGGALSLSEMKEFKLDLDVYQIVIYENFDRKVADLAYNFADLLKITNKGNQSFEYFKIDSMDIILLKGAFALRKLQEFLYHYEKNPPQKGSPLDTLFLAYGRPVNKINDIYHSYHDSLKLINRRFFCSQGQHTLGYEELPNINIHDKELTQDYIIDYATQITEHLQTFNRKKVAETLSQLNDYLYHVNNDIPFVKLFLTDLYLQIKEKTSNIYKTIDIPFPSNSSIIELIEKKYYLYEVIRFLSEQFEMIMNTTGNSSRDSIIDDIIYYIDHNYHKNIKLESIAPLFGYNSAYLGKIFSKIVGSSFNSYVDYIRINQSKELLLENRLKVYEISEQIGYKNVDYFHKKFKKYVGISPIEFRRQNELE